MQISAAESVIMEALWRRQPLTADEVIAEVAAAQDWSAPTVRTLLNRLLTKQAVSAERIGRRYLYRPLLERAKYVNEESRSFIDRMFDGRVASLITHFSEREQLSAEDIAELRRLVEEFDDDKH